MKGSGKQAVALQYSKGQPGLPSQGAPRVTAKGKDRWAEKIEQTARENDVPVMDIPGLAESLYTVDVGEEIPEDLYEITAHILTFIYSLEEKE